MLLFAEPGASLVDQRTSREGAKNLCWRFLGRTAAKGAKSSNAEQEDCPPTLASWCGLQGRRGSMLVVVLALAEQEDKAQCRLNN
jgi:hypothetical protein